MSSRAAQSSPSPKVRDGTARSSPSPKAWDGAAQSNPPREAWDSINAARNSLGQCHTGPPASESPRQ
ncbi:unnamed protein product, partial [Musa textilis]